MTRLFPLIALSFALLPALPTSAAPFSETPHVASVDEQKKPVPRPTPKPGPKDGGDED